jgi:hypothetical protein
MPRPEEESLIVVSDLDTLGLLPEYLEQVPEGVRSAKCAAAIDYVLSFLGRRAKRPVTFVDEALREAMIVRAYGQCLRFIGYPAGGSDGQFAEAEKKNEEWLKLVREGNVEPYFEDSTPDVAEFGPMGGTSETADAWVDP